MTLTDKDFDFVNLEDLEVPCEYTQFDCEYAAEWIVWMRQWCCLPYRFRYHCDRCYQYRLTSNAPIRCLGCSKVDHTITHTDIMVRAERI